MNEQLKVVYCRIVSWKALVEGAEHFYVNMEQRGSETITLWHILTESEAARLNRRKAENSRWEAGEDVGYFFSRDRGSRQP